MTKPHYYSRRAFLKAQIAAGALAVYHPTPSYSYAVSGDWARLARIAPSPLGEDETDAEMQTIINKLKAQNVSVIEADSILSYWLSDAQFDAHMTHVARFNTLVHQAGLKVVWYYPSLEVISQNGQTGPSMYKTNPTWVQKALNGSANVFYGSLVFWVEPGEESAWMSPNGPYRQYFLDRIKKLAATGTDAIWPDVPIYFDGTSPWADTSDWARTAAAAEGITIPSTENWNDPMWRRWIEWRHRNINNFLLAIRDAARSINPDILTYIETVTCDYKDATRIGLDGAYLRKADGISHVWEVDVVNLSTGMRPAKENDWICMIAMYKFAKAASGLKPAWAFSYGRQADDAALVMAEVVACGCNPFEIKTPTMESTANAAMRTRMYGFIQTYGERLFNLTSVSRVALYHSTASRDYVDGPKPGTGLYCTSIGGNNGWSNDPDDRTTSQQWLAEYRGMMKALIAAHIPFNLLTSPTFEAADLNKQRIVLLPDCEALSPTEVAAFKAFVQAGNMLIVTGPKPAGLNQFGDTLAPGAFADILGPSGTTSQPYGPAGGRVVYESGLPGKAYLASATQADYNKIINPILSFFPPFFTTTAPRQVHFEAGAYGKEVVLQFVNFTGVTGTFTVPPQTFSVTATIGRPVLKVEVASPDNATDALAPLAYTTGPNGVTFSLTLKQYSVVIINTT